MPEKNPNAVALGRLTSPKKAASSRANGKLGGWKKGRKRKPVQADGRSVSQPSASSESNELQENVSSAVEPDYDESA